MSSFVEELCQPVGTPCCANCFYNADEYMSEFELNDDGNLSCPNCGLVIEVERKANARKSHRPDRA